MLNTKLPVYEQLPVLSPADLTNHQGQLMFYDELVINVANFVHPGTKTVMQNWMGKQITNIFHQKSHSFNAKLMLVNLGVGRTSQQQGRGYQLFNDLKSEKMSVMHQKIMNNLDLKHGVLQQLTKLNEQQLEAFISIPKYYQNSSSIMFKQTKLQQMWYLDRFWVSTPIFTLIWLAVALYLHSRMALFTTYFRVVLFMLGLLLWTAVEYYFHRILLHLPLKAGMMLNGHYIHHAFPNIPNKLALSITKNLTIQTVAYLIFTRTGVLNSEDMLHLLLGLHMLMIMYDILHYYFHFGPELELPIISSLRKNHMKHHYRDANRGFGVTTVLWDHIFGTQHLT